VKILLSAFACRPGTGSEPGVGWNWAIRLANAGFEVWVLTRSIGRAQIETFLQSHPLPNLHFVYHDAPAAVEWIYHKPFGFYAHYLVWQWGAYRRARQLHKQVHFDRAHHVTIATVRQPSFMGLLGIPFVLGPVAGGETAPRPLRKSFPLTGKIREWLRDISNRLISIDPLMRLTFERANLILVTSRETGNLLPRRYQNKSRVQLAVAIEPDEIPGRTDTLPQSQRLLSLRRCDWHSEPFRILYVGRLLDFKGIHLGLAAFADVIRHIPESRMTIVGSGPDEKWIRSYSERLGLKDAVEWIQMIERGELLKKYADFDVFLFPSLHDSGGMVLLEAMLQGLPVVCFDLGGPATIVNNECGAVVPTGNRTEREVIESLRDQLITLASESHIRTQLGLNAMRRAQQFTWQLAFESIYGREPAVHNRFAPQYSGAASATTAGGSA
jgi:glycosyltransferase involved in cell wall biosynthesis